MRFERLEPPIKTDKSLINNKMWTLMAPSKTEGRDICLGRT